MRRFLSGMSLIGLWLWLSRSPLIGGVLELSEEAARTMDGFPLVWASFVLVLSNSLRAFLLYAGWFSAVEGLGLRERARYAALGLGIPASYWALNALQPEVGIHFGAPTFLASGSALLTYHISLPIKAPFYKVPLTAMLISALQWLDVIPSLTPLGFGGGELSSHLKGMAVLMGRARLLDRIAGFCFLLHASATVLAWKLFLSLEREIEQAKRIAELEERQLKEQVARELKFTVHDLKKPLTTVIGLLDLMAQGVVREDYVRRCLEASLRMNEMIGELLRPSATRRVRARRLLDEVMANARGLPGGEICEARLIGDPEGEVWVNLTRLCRAALNLVDNAIRAARDREDPLVRVELDVSDPGEVRIRVLDNGPPSEIKPGIGLALVEEVAREGKGSFEISRRDGLTEALLTVLSLKPPSGPGGEGSDA